MRRRRLLMNYQELLPKDNEIWYYASKKATLHSSSNVVSHDFSDGVGVLTFSSDITNVGDWLYGTNITNVKLPSKITTIGSYAFNNCSSLTSVNIPNSVITIGSYAFSWCSTLTYITIPNSVTSVGDYVFYKCISLTSITIPDSVTTIGNGVFVSCDSLTSVTVLATTPPALRTSASTIFQGSYPIYVPAASVNIYKTANYWSSIASRIKTI